MKLFIFIFLSHKKGIHFLKINNYKNIKYHNIFQMIIFDNASLNKYNKTLLHKKTECCHGS